MLKTRPQQATQWTVFTNSKSFSFSLWQGFLFAWHCSTIAAVHESRNSALHVRWWVRWWNDSPDLSTRAWRASDTSMIHPYCSFPVEKTTLVMTRQTSSASCPLAPHRMQIWLSWLAIIYVHPLVCIIIIIIHQNGLRIARPPPAWAAERAWQWNHLPPRRGPFLCNSRWHGRKERSRLVCSDPPYWYHFHDDGL